MAEGTSANLRDVLATAARRSLPPNPFAAPDLAETAAKLSKTWSSVDQMPTLLTIEEIVVAFRDAFAERHFERLQARHWRLLPFALWHGDPPLSANPTLLDAYEHRLRDRRSRRDLKGLIGVYLRDFAPERAGFMRLANLLAELVPTIDWPWREHHRALRMFDPRQAPDRLADHGLKHADGPIAALNELGLASIAAQGLPLAALEAVLHNLQESLTIHGDVEDVKLSTLLDWALSDDLGNVSSIRISLAHALLLPWAGPTGKQPAPALLKRLRDVLLKHYGDPRVRPKSWLGVDSDALKVFKRWLVDVAIEQFLEVIDRLTDDPIEKRQWRYRKAFWRAYLRRDWIWEADVMFREEGVALTRSLFGREAPCASLATGSKYVQSNHALLLMRIGRLIVADWSFNGKCVIWHESDQSAPRLGNRKYSSSEFDTNHARFAKAHLPAIGYGWQKKVRDYIAKHTSLRLNDHEFSVESSR